MVGLVNIIIEWKKSVALVGYLASQHSKMTVASDFRLSLARRLSLAYFAVFISLLVIPMMLTIGTSPCLVYYCGNSLELPGNDHNRRHKLMDPCHFGGSKCTSVST
jgi:hypothetical protein